MSADGTRTAFGRGVRCYGKTCRFVKIYRKILFQAKMHACIFHVKYLNNHFLYNLVLLQKYFHCYTYFLYTKKTAERQSHLLLLFSNRPTSLSEMSIDPKHTDVTATMRFCRQHPAIQISSSRPIPRII